MNGSSATLMIKHYKLEELRCDEELALKVINNCLNADFTNFIDAIKTGVIPCTVYNLYHDDKIDYSKSKQMFYYLENHKKLQEKMPEFKYDGEDLFKEPPLEESVEMLARMIVVICYTKNPKLIDMIMYENEAQSTADEDNEKVEVTEESLQYIKSLKMGDEEEEQLFSETMKVLEVDENELNSFHIEDATFEQALDETLEGERVPDEQDVFDQLSNEQQTNEQAANAETEEEAPEQPSQERGEPLELEHEEEPEQPAQPEHLEQPELPEQPIQADQPEHSEQPEEAEQLVEPGETDRADQAEHLEHSGQPGQPEEQDQDAPTAPVDNQQDHEEELERPERSGLPEHPELPEEPEPPTESELPGQPEHLQQPTQPEQTTQAGQPEHPEHLEEPACPVHSERPELPEEPELPEQPERSDSPEAPPDAAHDAPRDSPRDSPQLAKEASLSQQSNPPEFQADMFQDKLQATISALAFPLPPLEPNLPLVTSKIAVVGSSASGKTSLLRALANGQFDPRTQATTSLDIVNLRFSANNKSYSLAAFDTAGQEQFSRVLGSQVKKAELVLLCYAVSDKNSFDQLGAWLDKSGKTGQEAILCGLKADLAPQVSPEMIDAFCMQHKIRKSVICSAKTKEGVSAIFENVWLEGQGALETLETLDTAGTATKVKRSGCCW